MYWVAEGMIDMASGKEVLEKCEWSVFDKTSKFYHIFLLDRSRVV